MATTRSSRCSRRRPMSTFSPLESMNATWLRSMPIGLPFSFAMALAEHRLCREVHIPAHDDPPARDCYLDCIFEAHRLDPYGIRRCSLLNTLKHWTTPLDDTSTRQRRREDL